MKSECSKYNRWMQVGRKRIIICAIGLFVGIPSLFPQNKAIPALNQKIVAYVNEAMGTQIGRGECWDLANEVLTLNNAKWDGQYVYGKAIDYNKEPVFPGDIVHFEGVVIKQTQGFTTTTETMLQHTAIILKVFSKGIYELAHQNTSFSGRTVGTSPINLNGIAEGKVTIYRPTP